MPSLMLTYTGRCIKYQSNTNHLCFVLDDNILNYYPVGTLYKSIDETFDPNIVFGGVWITTNFEGRTPVGFFSSDSVSGGEETHTLTMSECPSHNHTFKRVLYGTFGNDKQNDNWNGYRSTNGSYDKVANGYLQPGNSTNKATHNNIQTSLICKIWERIS